MRRLFAFGLLCVLPGCNLPVPQQPVAAVRPNGYHTVAYYNANPLERAQTSAWCGDNQGLADKVPSCSNADRSILETSERQMGWRQ
jgi:hypothetical protein